jgi:hypothetical protein
MELAVELGRANKATAGTAETQCSGETTPQLTLSQKLAAYRGELVREVVEKFINDRGKLGRCLIRLRRLLRG